MLVCREFRPEFEGRGGLDSRDRGNSAGSARVIGGLFGKRLTGDVNIRADLLRKRSLNVIHNCWEEGAGAPISNA